MSTIPGVGELQRGASAIWNYASSWVPGLSSAKVSSQVSSVSSGVKKSCANCSSGRYPMMMPPAAGFFIRMAGLSGGAAVILGAYGAHALRPVTPEAREIFETGNRYHLIHSVALGLVPLTRHPRVTGALMIAGMLFFSGGCYGYSLVQNKMFRQVTPYGGVLLILAWLSMIF